VLRERCARLYQLVRGWRKPTPAQIYSQNEQGWFLVGTHRGEQHVRLEPFDAIALDLAALWER
jgi:hypothetical protein